MKEGHHEGLEKVMEQEVGFHQHVGWMGLVVGEEDHHSDGPCDSPP